MKYQDTKTNIGRLTFEEDAESVSKVVLGNIVSKLATAR